MLDVLLAAWLALLVVGPIVNLFVHEPIPGEKHDDEIDARLGRGSIEDDWPADYMQRWWAEGWRRRRRTGEGAPKARLL